jgi:hypothetical protein
MDVDPVKKLKIGYWPLSENLKSPGDRRRLIFWAKSRGHSIVTDLKQTVDVIVASENSDFNSAFFSQRKVPVVFDLVDAYLSPLNSFDDFARGIAKRFSHQISGGIKPFSHHVRDFCLNANAVICSSIEQEEEIIRYNPNTHVILDSHDEIPFIDPAKRRISEYSKRRILWEGQPATIEGVNTISPALIELSKTTNFDIDFVTDQKCFRFLNKYIEKDTIELIEKSLECMIDRVRIIPWTLQNLVESAEASEIAIIPLNLSIPMQSLKPENRLLIMWRLGLPCLTSPSPAYIRVSREAGVSSVSNNLTEWFENLNRLLGDPDFALNEILAGQNYLRENHNESILLSKWDLAFESVM